MEIDIATFFFNCMFFIVEVMADLAVICFKVKLAII